MQSWRDFRQHLLKEKEKKKNKEKRFWGLKSLLFIWKQLKQMQQKLAVTTCSILIASLPTGANVIICWTCQLKVGLVYSI